MPETYDVIVIGAGAAGAAAAVSLPEGVRALLIDRRDPRRGRCCGGLMAPDAQRAVADLGLALPDDVRVRPEPSRVHVRDLDSGRQQNYRRDYWNIDRAQLDAWLLELAAGRAEWRPRTRFESVERSGDLLVIRLSKPGHVSAKVRARLLIGADGAESAVRRGAWPSRAMPPTAIALQARIEGAIDGDADEVLFGRELTDFYAWAIPKEGSVLIGTAFRSHRDARRRFEAVLAEMRRQLGLDGRVLGRSARYLTRPVCRADLLAGDDRILLAGEAAGLVSPSSGEGLSFALASGTAAGRAVAAAAPGEAYARAFRRQARRVARKLLKAGVIFSPRLRRLALRLPWCP